jgi:hypothetical protein
MSHQNPLLYAVLAPSCYGVHCSSDFCLANGFDGTPTSVPSWCISPWKQRLASSINLAEISMDIGFDIVLGDITCTL